MKRLHQILIFTLVLALLACSKTANVKTNDSFIRVHEGQFIKDGKPYYYVGANFWYGAILASEGEGGDRKRLIRELDSLSAIGVDNLRILVGADGANGVKSKVEPTLQIAPSVYNDTILDGLDYLLFEMDKRNMSAVLYLNNSWEWSGGYGQYLEWAGYGKAPIPAVDGWASYMDFVKQFHACDSCKQMFAMHVENIIARVNRYTGNAYVDEACIMSWQIGNEPRAFGEKQKEPFAKWIQDVAKQIRHLDPNHLISIGSEGSHGCEGDIELWDLIHSYPEVDYLTIHIWPYNWGWINKDDLASTSEKAKEETKLYIDKHLERAVKYKKPLVIEEFGFIRDEFKFTIGSPTHYRDDYYKYVFNLVVEHAKAGNYLAGCNFWAWGGFAKQNPNHVFWEKGDDYMGDPAQEEQGLYSVFSSDTSTIDVVKRANELLSNQ